MRAAGPVSYTHLDVYKRQPAYVFAGIACCVTIIAIPFGLQSFKMAKLSLLPFGSVVR